MVTIFGTAVFAQRTVRIKAIGHHWDAISLLFPCFKQSALGKRRFTTGLGLRKENSLLISLFPGRRPRGSQEEDLGVTSQRFGKSVDWLLTRGEKK